MQFLSICLLVFGYSFLVNSQLDSCNSSLSLNEVVTFNTTSLRCTTVWDSHGFIVRYARSGMNLWSFILSAPNPNSYIAIGFSTDGNMVGSSAIVGWMGINGTGVIKQYDLKGTRESQVSPDQGSLQLVNGSMAIISRPSILYLVFQLISVQPQSRLIYAVGPTNGVPSSNNILSEHQDKASTYFDYVQGKSTIEGSHDTLRKSHGIVNMLGWGILIPIGALIARYFKEWDPAWFYAHISIQTVGFILGLAGIITGFSLDGKLSSDVGPHKALGVLVLVNGCLQVTAFLIRPDKESKARIYWNWWHSNVGRVLIGVAIGNVFYGISLGGGGSSWNIGYGVVIAAWLVLAIALEVRMYKKK
ncbi:cytochrome b561 and DOMON domain-containing protein At3g07570-like [Magnolia sinica]|uniref:cytochrome b561 and DOMON domain-containing protein At3g07570-like n=1 Tax=Magnolia sinica TaxID=86752 RepID=UPI002659BF35|nr:cytochrome b561 and DOMON domain-containing protein At3g07570-like [Magnolia sinica]